MGVDKTVSKGVYSAVIGELPAAETVSRTRYGDVLPSNKALAGAGVELDTCTVVPEAQVQGVEQLAHHAELAQLHLAG